MSSITPGFTPRKQVIDFSFHTSNPQSLWEHNLCKFEQQPRQYFPSTELVHKNMELYQSIPNMTVRFERRFNDHFDEYTIVFSPELPLLHEVRTSIGAVDGQPRRVLFATGSRPFLDLHHRAFQEHHKSAIPAMSRFDELVSQQLFSQIMLYSPTMRDNRNRVKNRKKSSSAFEIVVRDDNCRCFSQFGVSPEAARRGT